MNNTSRQTLALARQARSSVTPAVRQAGRARARFQSTGFTYKNADASHAVAGLAGGAAVVLLGYGYYYVSGTKKVVNTARDTINSFTAAKDKIKDATPSPGAAMSLLRHVAHSYASVIPGASGLVDTTFDQLDKLVNENGEKAMEIVNEAYSEFQGLINDPSKDAGQKITELLARVGQQIRDLGEKADQDYITPFIENNPQLKKAFEGSQQQLQDLISKHGPDAQALKDDTLKQLTAIAAAGFSGDGISKAIALVKEQSAKAKNIVSSTGEDAYKSFAANSQQFLSSMPDLKKLLDDQLPRLAPIIGDKGANDVKQMYGQLENLAKTAGKKDAATLAKEAKQIVVENLSKLQEAGAQATSKVVGSAGGLFDIGGLSELANFKIALEKQGPEAEKLAESAYQEVKDVLAKKLQEAKKLGEKAKNEVKK